MERRVIYNDLGAKGAARRMAALTEAGYALAPGEGAAVQLIDGAEASAEALDTAVTAARGGGPILAVFSLTAGTNFRDRSEALTALGAADVMQASSDTAELVTRVEALAIAHQPPRILIVEDIDKIAAWMAEELAIAGMETLHAATLADGRAAFEATPVDMLIVDRGLPDGDGLDLVRALRRTGIQTPVLVYTALDDIDKRIEGLEDAGADDYLIKPVHADELRARVRVALRPKRTQNRLSFGPLDLDRRDRVIRWRGARIDMRKRESEMLIYLGERAGLAIPRRMIYLDVWQKVHMDPDSDPVAAAKHRMMRELKAALAARDEALPDFLETKSNAYRFRPEPLLRLGDDGGAGGEGG